MQIIKTFFQSSSEHSVWLCVFPLPFRENQTEQKRKSREDWKNGQLWMQCVLKWKQPIRYALLRTSERNLFNICTLVCVVNVLMDFYSLKILCLQCQCSKSMTEMGTLSLTFPLWQMWRMLPVQWWTDHFFFFFYLNPVLILWMSESVTGLTWGLSVNG